MYKKSPPDSSEGLLGVVGMTGFEPATTRPPDVYSTKLSYIPVRKSDCKSTTFCEIAKLLSDFFILWVNRLFCGRVF